MNGSLQNDSRYLLLDKMPDERERLLEQYLTELARAGTPPPPTATEPDRPNRRNPPSASGASVFDDGGVAVATPVAPTALAPGSIAADDGQS